MERTAKPACERARGVSGFTLIEIMAVVMIIGLLSSLVGYAVFQQVDKGRMVATRAQISNLEGVLELYRMDNARFPTTEQGLDALVHKSSISPEPRRFQAGGYMKKVPVDPWGEPYHYESPGINNSRSFDLWSTGADSAPGGEDIDADIVNWNEDTGAG